MALAVWRAGVSQVVGWFATKRYLCSALYYFLSIYRKRSMGTCARSFAAHRQSSREKNKKKCTRTHSRTRVVGVTLPSDKDWRRPGPGLVVVLVVLLRARFVYFDGIDRQTPALPAGLQRRRGLFLSAFFSFPHFPFHPLDNVSITSFPCRVLAGPSRGPRGAPSCRRDVTGPSGRAKRPGQVASSSDGAGTRSTTITVTGILKFGKKGKKENAL